MAALSTGYSPRAQRLRAVALHANENGSGVERQAHIRLEHVRRKFAAADTTMGLVLGKIAALVLSIGTTIDVGHSRSPPIL
jgi:hypothetical protein